MFVWHEQENAATVAQALADAVHAAFAIANPILGDSVKLPPSEITEKALGGSSPLCRQTLDIFCAMLGTVASNHALMLGARGGVYLCGGIIPRVLEYFKTSPFRSRFENKGRFEAYLAAIPVYVVLSEFPGISGAAVALDNHLRNV